MQEIGPEIRRISSRLADAERRRKRLSGFLKASFPGLFRKVDPHNLDSIGISAVDGGIVKRSLHGFDCALVRAAGVHMDYREGRLAETRYWPSRNPTPVPKVFEALSDIDWAYTSSLLRMETEADAALACLERFRPGILMMDGSIVPHYSDRPGSGSAKEAYSRVLKKYRDLYSRSLQSGTVLAGIVEDSRSSRFCGMLKDEVMPKSGKELTPDMSACLETSRDTSLLYSGLSIGEMTSPFPYARSVSGHAILKELGEHAHKISTFYIKTARLDRPIKVDFLGGEPESLASVLLATASQHPSYGIPVPIIEADNVAKLSEDDMERLCSLILNETGDSPMRLRRDQRPF